jgi:hypothetical protein
MPPTWLVPRSIYVAIALSMALLVGVVIVWHRHDRDVLPPPVVRAIDAERASRPHVDSQVTAAYQEAAAAQARKDSAEAHAHRMERTAQREGHRADSLAVLARFAGTARDSALFWHLAYGSRTTERDSLAGVIDTLHVALDASRAEALSLHRGLDVADSARHRADSVLDATVTAVRRADCRVPGTFGLVHCMSRRDAALVGLALGVAGTVTVGAIRDGRLSLKVPLP